MAISEQDRHFLKVCDEVRQQSHDPDRQVGAVIVGTEGHPLAVGTNAPPAALGLTIDQSREAIQVDPAWKYFVLEHAERNAIFDALLRGVSLKGATIYGSLYPCADCARAIVATGLARLVVVGPGLDPDRDQKWLDHYRHAEEILRIGGVLVDVINPRDVSH